jgi:LL-diaminopimelate aminotransferase
MALINENFLKLQAGYLFPEINRRVNAFLAAKPEAKADLIRCGIGDVTEPLPQACIAALHQAVDEMALRESFRGYGPEQGYDFLRNAIAEHDFQSRGAAIEADEIFISDGSKCDGANLLHIFGSGNRVAVMDPVYPVYVDTNVMAGNTGNALPTGGYEGLVYLPCHPANDFVPELPKEKIDFIYLCYPNNPTGATVTKAQLRAWVDYARANGAIILFDAAYEAYISTHDAPHTIYEIEGAKECAIELRSFSKNGGFTGLRCAFTVVPKTLLGMTRSGEKQPLHPLWLRNQTTTFNGVAYIVQRAAAALYTPEGKAQIAALVAHYMENAKRLRAALETAGLKVYGGIDAPYLWVQGPQGVKSWDLFDRILDRARIVTTPGSGFGKAGEGYFRLSAFNNRANVDTACERLKNKAVFE